LGHWNYIRAKARIFWQAFVARLEVVPFPIRFSPSLAVHVQDAPNFVF